MKKLTTFLLLLSAATLASAGERVTWEQLKAKLGSRLQHRSITVVTRGGKTVKGRTLEFIPSGAYLDSSPLLLADVARVEVRDRGIYRHKIVTAATNGVEAIALGCAGLGELEIATCPLGLAFGLPMLAAAVAITPPVAVADAIALLHPAQIYDVEP